MKDSTDSFTLLLVTDDLECQHLVRRVMRNENFQTLTAPKWNAAIALAQETEPDLVLVDFDLSGIGCNVLATRLHAIPGFESTPILALVNPEQQGQVSTSGYTGSVKKPLDPRQLPEELSRLIQEPTTPLDSETRISNLNQLLVEMTELLEEQELELEARERRLREANRLRGNFLINVSRELRTPLTLI